MSKTSSNSPFTPDAGSFISHQEAHDLVTNFLDQNKDQKHTVVRAIFFGKEKVQQLLNMEGAVGIRIYYGLHPNPGIGQPYSKKMVIVPVDKDGHDLHGTPMKAPDPNAKGTGGTFLDDGLPCPDKCPPPPNE